MRKIKRGLAKLNAALPRPVKLVAVGVGASVVRSAFATDPDPFDLTTLYSGVAIAFGAAATVAGGFLAIKFGAKMVKKAWAWLT